MIGLRRRRHRPKRSPRGRVAVLAALSLLVWAGWLIVAKTATTSAMNEAPEAALRWSPDSPEALTRLAQQKFDSAAGAKES